jgi:predicted permease
MGTTLWQDLRYAARMLWKRPGFTIAAVMTLALGIGANTAIFSVVNNIFMRPLPLAESERLVRLRDSMTDPGGHRESYNISNRNFLGIAERNRIFSGVSAQSGENMTLTGGDSPERLSVISVSAGSWDTLGVKPQLGRVFSAEEERKGRDSQVALIAYNFWQRHFGGAQDVIGRTLSLNEQSYTIIGVTPRGYNFPYDAQVWIPATINPAASNDYAVFARLNPGVTLDQVRADMENVSRLQKEQYPDIMPGYGIDITPLRESLIDDQDRIALALLAIVSFFLLLACANVANLMLARSMTRQREFAIRAALGASRWRQARQLLTESVLVSALGSLVGLLLAVLLGDYLVTLVPSNLSEQLGLADVSLDLRVIGFTMTAALLTGVVSGLAPALKSSNPDLQTFMKDGGKTSTGGRSRRLLSTFVISEIALAFVLLTGAGLMIKNLQRLSHSDLGFNPEKLLTMEVTLPAERYAEGPRRAAFVAQALERIQNEPGVTAAAVTTTNPLAGGTWGAPIVLEGQEATGATYVVNHRLISPDLFHVMGQQLIRGRAFTGQDDAEHPGVAIISERMARRFWPGDDPIGKRLRINRQNEEWLTVVGVVNDVKDSGEMQETWYLPYAQHPATPAAEAIHLMVRGALEPGLLTRTVQQAVWSVDRNLAIYDVSTMDQVRSETLSQDRLGTITVTLFAIFGLMLAALGVYGVMSFAVSQRTHEMGIRMALGAQRSDVLKLVVGQGMILAGIGLVVGLIAALILTRVMSSLLFGIGTTDPLTFAIVSLLLGAVAVAASYLPARRATRVDPMVALRYE